MRGQFRASADVLSDATDLTQSSYTFERTEDTITTESGKFITIDYTNRKLRVYAIGVCGNYEISY